jgi:hypothetical protein
MIWFDPTMVRHAVEKQEMMPNETLQATPVFAILFLLSQVPGAPEFCRWAVRRCMFALESVTRREGH